jgi:hypothetical protein
MTTTDREAFLTPGRTCGACNVCCIIPAIDDPDLQKQTSVACANCGENGGCGIYETRPNVCREYFCYWRYKTNLGDGWRPDLSGVFINPLNEAAPEGYKGTPIEMRLLWPSALLWVPFAEVVMQFVKLNVPVYLSIPGPEGHHPAKTLLNPMVYLAVARGDIESMQGAFVDAHTHLLKHPFKPVILKHAPQPVG